MEETERKIPRLIDLIGTPIINILNENDITPERLAKKLNAELEAEDTKFFQKDGVVVETHNVIDWKTRQTARMDAHRLMGHYPPEIKGDAYIQIFQQNNVIISPVVKELLSRHSREMTFDEPLEVEFKEVK